MVPALAGSPEVMHNNCLGGGVVNIILGHLDLLTPEVEGCVWPRASGLENSGPMTGPLRLQLSKTSGSPTGKGMGL